MSHPSRASLRRSRHHGEAPNPGDYRSEFRRDRDRILYSSAFKRLSDVTQVIGADNAHVFHNRLTHSLQVAQVGQSIAEDLISQNKTLARDVIDIDVVQAACLAHDLGHPPFGHTAEEELKRLGKENGLRDTFEGNAQSFRIVTKLAFRATSNLGLNLTRATLAALLKYPWQKGAIGERAKKWGAYDSESSDFNWACELLPSKYSRSSEAQLMDWADDVTYAVHDMEDFYRAGRIPLHLLSASKDDRERKDFYDEVFTRRKNQDGVWNKYTRADLETAFESLITISEIDRPYAATQDHRSKLRRFSARCIDLFIRAVSFGKDPVSGLSSVRIDPIYEKQVTMLKELTWHYVINAPALATQQHGQRKVIRGLFECFLSAATKNTRNLQLFPTYYREKIRDASDDEIPRLVIDLIAGMTERQSVDIFHTLTGISLSPSFERVI